MHKKWLAVAALSGFTTIALGAFGSHGLKSLLTPGQLATWETAVQYQMFHTLALLVLAFTGQLVCHKIVRLTGWLFSLGIVLFCGSLYALCLTGINKLGIITPIGGTAFLAGWALLAIASLRKNRI